MTKLKCLSIKIDKLLEQYEFRNSRLNLNPNFHHGSFILKTWN